MANESDPRVVDDVEVAAFLAGRALVEIRYLAADRPPWDRSSSENLDRIRFLADMAHNLPSIASGGTRRRDRQRPMSWMWNSVGAEGRALMLRWISEAGYRWTPPPPPTETPRRNLRQRTSLLTGWPVDAPSGRAPLPREARRLKALDTDAVCAILDEAERLQLGVGGDAPWHREHLSADAVHYIVPDPAERFWPGQDGDASILWWHCWLVLTMCDGQRVRSRVAVMPETFVALPDAVPRHRQHRLLHEARGLERDAYVWRIHHAASRPTAGPGT